MLENIALNTLISNLKPEEVTLCNIPTHDDNIDMVIDLVIQEVTKTKANIIIVAPEKRFSMIQKISDKVVERYPTYDSCALHDEVIKLFASGHQSSILINPPIEFEDFIKSGVDITHVIILDLMLVMDTLNVTLTASELICNTRERLKDTNVRCLITKTTPNIRKVNDSIIERIISRETIEVDHEFVYGRDDEDKDFYNIVTVKSRNCFDPEV